MSRAIVVIVGAVVIAVAVLVGGRMTEQAMGVVVGVVCGIGACIPMSLLVIALAGRRHEDLAPPPAPRVHIDTVQILIAPPADAHSSGALTVLPRRVR